MHGFPVFLVLSEDAMTLFKTFRQKDEKQSVRELEKEAYDYADQLEREGVKAVVVWA